MEKLYIQAITENGCCVYANIKLPKNYTMNQVVTEIKRLGYKAFRIVETRMKFVYV